MKVLGITGGIATGKSTVTQMLADCGAPTVSADALAHALLAPGTPTTQAVLAAFPDCRAASEKDAVDRRLLGRLVFSEAAARRRLESLTHPAIIAALRQQVAVWHEQIAAGRGAGEARAAAAEIPLLFEARLEALTDCIVVAACAEETQIARLRARLTADEAEVRRLIAAQWPLTEKIARADVVITTDGTLEETRLQVEALWNSL